MHCASLTKGMDASAI